MTYNIHKGIGGRDRRYQLDRIIDVIESQNPDIICLQEVDRNVRRSKFDNQPVILAQRFAVGGASDYQFNVRLKSGGYGNLILSRWKFRTQHDVSLRLRRKKPRGAQLVVVDSPEGPVHIVQWHLGLAEKERHWQVSHLLGHRLFQESESLPTIVIGDFNDWRNTLHTGQLGDVGFEQVTSPISRFRSFPAWLPMGSLDKAFVRGPIQVHGIHVLRNRLTRQASDHLPLVMDFHLPTARPDLINHVKSVASDDTAD